MSSIALKTLTVLATASLCVTGFAASAQASRFHGGGGSSFHGGHGPSAPHAFAPHFARVSHGPSLVAHPSSFQHPSFSGPRQVSYHPFSQPAAVNHGPILTPRVITKTLVPTGPVVVVKAPTPPPIVINKVVATDTNVVIDGDVTRVPKRRPSTYLAPLPRYHQVYAPLPAPIPSTYVAPLPAPVTATYVAPLQAGKSVYVADDGSYVGVSFLPTCTAADIANFLQAYSVSIVSGPTADGVYKIRLSDKVLPASRVQDVIDSMRSQTAIVQAVKI